MQVLLVPFGSHGDVHPLIGLGLVLRSRGHRVTFLQPEYFGPLIRGLGFEMVSFGGEGRMEEAMSNPDLWHPRKAFPLVARSVIEGAGLVYRLIAEHYVAGETVAVGGSIALGVRLAQEKLGIPAATVHLQPGVIHSNEFTPNYAGVDTNRWPKWLKRAFYNLVYANVIDPHIEPPLNALRAEIGLPPVRDLMRGWIHSPELVLGFFPAWFGPPQPDWPPNVKLVGFPLYDERDATPLSPEIDTFLKAGTPPIAFTPGSANIFGRPFFDAAVDACVRLGRRGILLTRFPEQVPTDLPDGVRHFAYAPFSQLLPRVAALVHHGGIGTASQAMAAGIPQLIMPLAHDQFDNASRMKRLGIAKSLVPKKFKGPAIARLLNGWIDAPEVAASCRLIADRIAKEGDALEQAAEAIEAMDLKRRHPEVAPPE
jgi:rhamnosyltransferase subunit B